MLVWINIILLILNLICGTIEFVDKNYRRTAVHAILAVLLAIIVVISFFHKVT